MELAFLGMGSKARSLLWLSADILITGGIAGHLEPSLIAEGMEARESK